MNDPAYDTLRQYMEKFIADSELANGIEDRVIACDILRAACTNYIAEHKPDGWAAFSAHVSRVIQSAKERKNAKRRNSARSQSPPQANRPAQDQGTLW